ncbi:uncharacterized protein EI90DRAFT_3051023 [Cantharellus anzutake]|uniref:uncharacterized protein n=1 Tax=Cantharellus anzutake TaxID=1750568 RepID=UPI001907380B|nr:uncharacterized protein EI90DRAFT_3051023 [Cantharellus anzutake]KAF8334103.1 hypothetical protein EI90DRAFT_3051023 [Cantharellus anzutake]
MSTSKHSENEGLPRLPNEIVEPVEQVRPNAEDEGTVGRRWDATLARAEGATLERSIYWPHKPRSESPDPLRGKDGSRVPTIPRIDLIEPTPIRAGPELPQVGLTEKDPGRLESGSALGGHVATTHSSNPSGSSSIWQVIVDQATHRDAELVDGWQRSMDVLLLFAALFAGILTAFLIESTKRLEGNYPEEMVVLLRQIAQSLNGTLPAYVPPESRRSASTLLLINRLWFSSLSLTLGSAIGGMVAKQWLSEYMTDLTFESRNHYSQERYQREARLREFRYNGLTKWYVPEIIGFLPIALHVALLLFWVGLVHYLWELDLYTTILVLVISGTIFASYIGSTILPSIFTGCPYKTPISHLISNTNRAFRIILNWWPKNSTPEPNGPSGKENIKVRFREALRVHRVLWEDEREVVERHSYDLDEKCLERLKESTRSESTAVWAAEELQGLLRRRTHTVPYHPTSISRHVTTNDTTSGVQEPKEDVMVEANGNAAPLIPDGALAIDLGTVAT